jgi:hypothetical protein
MTYKTYYFNHLSLEIKSGAITKLHYSAGNLSEGTEEPPIEYIIALIKAAFLSKKDSDGTFDFYDQILENEGDGWKMTARTQDPPPPPKPPKGFGFDLDL